MVEAVLKPIHDIEAEHNEDQQTKIARLEQKVAELQALTKGSPSESIQLSPSKKQRASHSQATAPQPKQFQLATDTALKPDLKSQPLKHNAPPGHQAQEIKKWLTSIKQTLPSDHSTSFEKYLTDVHNAYFAILKKERPALPDIAAAWGLPVASASTFTDKALMQVSAAATYQAALATA